jgi:hypothetical protein
VKISLDNSLKSTLTVLCTNSQSSLPLEPLFLSLLEALLLLAVLVQHPFLSSAKVTLGCGREMDSLVNISSLSFVLSDGYYNIFLFL